MPQVSRRWEITPQELHRLRKALLRSAEQHELDAALEALAGWGMALVDASTIAVALREAPAGPPLVRAVAGRGRHVPQGQPLDEAGPRRPSGEWLKVPIRLNGSEAGVVAARGRARHRLDRDDAEVLRLIAAQAAMAVAQDRADVRIAVARAREEAAAAERARLARELHDETAQQLVAVGRRIDLLLMEVGSGPLARALDELHDMVDQCLIDVRRISRDLRPAILEDLGLQAAIEALIADLARSGGAPVELRVDGQPRPLPPGVELVLYRIVQEALGNALRHADPTRVSVRLVFGQRDVAVEVSDDGRGFVVPLDLSGVVKSGGMGIVGMHERAEEIGGQLKIESEPGRGTLVRARVPCPP